MTYSIIQLTYGDIQLAQSSKGHQYKSTGLQTTYTAADKMISLHPALWKIPRTRAYKTVAEPLIDVPTVMKSIDYCLQTQMLDK